MGLKFWQDKAELAPAHQVSAFEVVEVEREWVGHYACNVLDANVVIGSFPVSYTHLTLPTILLV